MPAKQSCCIANYCGMPFDPAQPEMRTAEQLRAFWWLYCPKHRAAPAGQVIVVGRDNHGHTRYVATGEFRGPRKGEHYLSGALINAYRAPNDLSQEFWIARAVVIEKCRVCQGTGEQVKEEQRAT